LPFKLRQSLPGIATLSSPPVPARRPNGKRAGDRQQARCIFRLLDFFCADARYSDSLVSLSRFESLFAPRFLFAGDFHDSCPDPFALPSPFPTAP
jgi:hypothetical protein